MIDFESEEFKALSPSKRLALLYKSQQSSREESGHPPREDELLLDPSMFDNLYDQQRAEKKAREIGVEAYLKSMPKRRATPAEVELLRQLPPAKRLQEARRRGIGT